MQANAFQYISCYCLSSDPPLYCPPVTYFNTSHVTVYRYLRGRFCGFSDISIHLMLLFIVFHLGNCSILDHFNTSHVTVYRYTRSSPTSSNLISIHLMLLFISLPYPHFGASFNFNTSHVTVYRCTPLLLL